MPKFSEQEKEQIRQCLLTKGKELFTKFGLSKTSIDDIVLACGIAKGSFYKFYSSKEDLYLAVLRNEEEIRDRLLQQHFRENLTPRELVSAFFRKAFELVDENPLLQTAFVNGEYERLVRKVPQHQNEDSSKRNAEKGVEAVRELMERGVFGEEDPQVVTGVLRAVMMLRLHKDQFPADLYPAVMDKIIDYVAEGLTKRRA